FTDKPYAAVSFYKQGTPGAQQMLYPIQRDIQLSWAIDSKRHFELPAGLELAGYQKAGVEYALAREHCLIGDEPGLGKTMQAIVVANEMQAQRVLVIVPA